MPNIKQIQLPNENIYDILDSNALHESNLKSTTKSTLAAADKGSTANKEYAVGYDKNGKLSVNVPWTDNNTTYSAGDGIDITNTVIKNTGVRSISTGSSNGTISVNTNGSSANVSVKGLGNAAYTNVTDTYSSSGTAPASGKAIKNAFDTIAPMIYQGTLGTGGTITTLPTAASGNKGYVYNVITAGTYDSKSAIVGDMFVSNGSAWVLIPSGDEPTGTVTKISTGVGLTGGDITTTGTIKAKLKSETASTLDSAAMGSTANKQYAVGVDKSGYLSVNIPWTDTNTKVTSVGNHYAPTEDSSAQLSADASGGSAATWNSTQLVTGVDIKRDAKGHVTGIAVDSIKMPANPDTNTTYTFTASTNGFTATPSSGTAQSVTINDSTKLPLAGGTMTGQIKLASTGFRTNADNGYSVDANGNFKHLSTGTTSNYWHLDDMNGNNKFTVYWETGNVVAGGSVQVGTSGTIASGDSKLVTGNTVYGALQGYLPTSGGTLTGRTKFNNVVMPLSAGKVTNLTAGTTEVFKDGIAISNPATSNDVGWIRVTGTGETDTVMEIATGDDAGAGEQIVVRQYNTSNNVAREAKLFDTSGNTSFPNTLTSGNVVSNGTVQVGGTACTMQYNTTTQSLDFVFA